MSEFLRNVGRVILFVVFCVVGFLVLFGQFQYESTYGSLP